MGRRTWLILLLLLLLPMAAAAEQTVYTARVSYHHGLVAVEEVSLVNSTTPNRQPRDDPIYRAEALSFNGTVLETTRFTFPLDMHNHFGGMTRLDEATTTVVLPYHPAASTLRIVDPDDGTAAQYSLAHFATCDLDSRCEDGEGPDTCPSDCSGGLPVPLLAGIVGVLIGAAILYYRTTR